jgi:general secretion pathway protein D
MRVCTAVLAGLLLMLLASEASLRLVHAARLDTDEKSTAEEPATRRPARGTSASNNTIHLNFRDADLLQIINLMSELTGKNFLVDDKVRGKVTIIAPKPVTFEEAYQVFLSVLEIQGFTVVTQGPIIKIVPSREVKERPLPTAVDGQRPPSGTDEFITQLIPLEFADANDMRALLTPLVSKQSSMLAYVPTNTLVLTDVSSNISRLLKIIRALDVESPAAALKVVSLKYAAAEQLSTSLQSALESLAQVGGADGEAPAGTPARRPARPQAATQRTPKGPKIIPDSRTNSLVLIATQTDMASAENLITQLDVPTPEGRGQIHVYYLAHANAEELAKVLTAQTSDLGRPRTARDTPTPTTPTTRRPTPTTTPTTTPATTGSLTVTSPGGVTITADKSTNALVISAPPEVYAVLKGIIEKLDIRRSQVLVESLIAEVTLDKTQQLGVEWRVIDTPNGTQVFSSSTGSTGDTGTGVLNPLTTNPLTSVPGFLIGALRNTLTIGNTQVFNIPAVLRAFQGDSNVNILATPNLLTTDNEEAEIIIGEERPFLRSAQDAPVSGTTTTTAFSTIRTFEFKDTGITLRITPQISQGRTVRLNLSQEVKNFLSQAETGAVTTSKRSAKTTVIVDDGQTIVIGGLIQEQTNDAKTQVPCLGNLPLFGWAFKQTAARKTKTNLLIFITPHIITSPDDVHRLTERKRGQSEQAPEIEQKLRENHPLENREILLN